MRARSFRLTRNAAVPLMSLIASSAVVLACLPAVADAAPAPEIAWGACMQQELADAGFECGRIVVPRDRANPSGPTFSIAVTRHRSTGTTEERIGSLFFNPGGPGGSGLASAAGVWGVLPDELRSRFDLVSWDPRGVGASTPALQSCASPYPTRPATGKVDWNAVVSSFLQRVRRVQQKCYEANRGVIEYVGTNEVVEDLDDIREALGEESLTYWGMSYGTRIGYVYALRHPTRVRAVLLDGPVDPAGSIVGFGEGGVGPDQAFSVFAAAYPTAAHRFFATLAALNKKALPLPDGTAYTRWNLLDNVLPNMAQQAYYGALATYIDLVHRAVLGSGADQQEAINYLATRPKHPPNGSTGGVFAAVNCLDYPDRPTQAQMVAAVESAHRYAPLYGGSLATMYVTNCEGLPVIPDPIPLITGRGSSVPVLISGSTLDGSTVSIWLARMSRAFPRSRTITYSGGQHVVWVFAHSTCVNDVVDRYFIERALPRMDVGCSNAVELPPATQQGDVSRD